MRFVAIVKATFANTRNDYNRPGEESHHCKTKCCHNYGNITILL
jgi:hypothetical protein